MAASWHSVCPRLAGAMETSVSPLAAGMFAPLADASTLGGFSLVVLENVTATRNVAAQRGGFAYVDMRSKLLPNDNGTRLSLVAVEDTTVAGNTALAGGGGGMYVASARLGMRGVNLTGNVAGGAGSSGGGLLVQDSPGLVLVDSVRFEVNAAAESGGGMWSRDSTVAVNSSLFSRNAAVSGDGGALFVGGTAAPSTAGVTVRNTVVTLNSAGQSGGGVGAEGIAFMDISNCARS